MDRRLGEPLPHQLPNPTRAPPRAAEAFAPQGTCGISLAFARLSPTLGQVPTRYSPVRHSCIATGVRLACVRHAASVRSEPGSNSQVEFLYQISRVRRRASLNRGQLKESRLAQECSDARRDDSARRTAARASLPNPQCQRAKNDVPGCLYPRPGGGLIRPAHGSVNAAPRLGYQGVGPP